MADPLERMIGEYVEEWGSEFVTQSWDVVPKVDWIAYYKEFERLHGGHPQQYGSRLIFSDGWTYSAYDHMGPEYPPPENEYRLLRAKKTYWLLRRNKAKKVVGSFETRVNNLADLQEFKSAPLMYSTQRVVEDLGDGDMRRVEKVTKPLDIAFLRMQLDAMKDELAFCESELRKINQLMESDNGNPNGTYPL